MSESFANINFNNESVPATRHNTTVYNHYGKDELYDHVWIDLNGEQGAYIWAQIPPDNPAYTALARVAVESGCETHLNIQKVSEHDLKAFGRTAIGDLSDIPDWLPEI